MNVKEIVTKYLEDNGFDGLMDDYDCVCDLNDLMPCVERSILCEPAVIIPCKKENCHDWCEGDCDNHLVSPEFAASLKEGA